MAAPFRLPNDTHRHMIYGKTGSGKTVAGLWALEKRSWNRRPWIVVDFKCDGLIGRIPRLEEFRLGERPPKHAGLYVVRPVPGSSDDDEKVTELLWRVWDQEKTGLFIDEGFMIHRFNKALTAVLTQGRSKQVPIIGLSQRPSWLNPFWMSEADFHQVMHITRPADEKTLRDWVPGLRRTQLDFHSQYYDDGKDKMTVLNPVPDEDEILDRFDLKMPRKIHLFRDLHVNAAPSRAKLRRVG